MGITCNKPAFFRTLDMQVFDALKDVKVYESTDKCTEVPCCFGMVNSDKLPPTLIVVTPEPPVPAYRSWWSRLWDRLMRNRGVPVERTYCVEIRTPYFEYLNQIVEQIFARFGGLPHKFSTGTLVMIGVASDEAYGPAKVDGENVPKKMSVFLNFQGRMPARWA